MADTRSDMPQDPGRTAKKPIQVLVLLPDEEPRLQTIENRPDALKVLVGGSITTSPTGIEDTIGVANAGAPSPTSHRAIDGMGPSISGIFVVAGDAGDSVTLQSI